MGNVLPTTKNGRVSANYDGRKDVLSDLATNHHVPRREAAAALKARAALGSAPIMPVFLGPFGPSRRS